MEMTEVYEVKKLKFKHKAFTNYSNLWIDCVLELGSWSQLEKANQDYIEEIVDKFRDYVADFRFEDEDD